MYALLELGFDFLILLGEACVFFALCWLIAKKIDNWSIVDVAWSYGFALVGLQILAVHFFVFPLGGQGLLMAAATILWSLRLGTHLAVRVLGHLGQEDGRYLKMRAEHGERMAAQMLYFYFIQAAGAHDPLPAAALVESDRRHRPGPAHPLGRPRRGRPRPAHRDRRRRPASGFQEGPGQQGSGLRARAMGVDPPPELSSANGWSGSASS